MHARDAFLLILVLLAAGRERGIAAAAEKGDDRAALETQLKQLRTEHVASAKRARAAAQAAYEAETVPLSDLLWAIDALFSAELAAATTPAQQIDAHVHHVRNLMQVDQKIEALFEKGERGGEAEKQARVKYCLESALIALVEHCIATGQPFPKGQVLPAAAQPAQP